MSKFFRILLSTLTALIIVAISPVNHASAMQPHSMAHGSHGSSTNMSQHCLMMCGATSTNKENKAEDKEAQDKNKADPLFYQQFDSVYKSYFVERKMVSRSIEVPPDIPKYRLCCVIRR